MEFSLNGVLNVGGGLGGGTEDGRGYGGAFSTAAKPKLVTQGKSGSGMINNTVGQQHFQDSQMNLNKFYNYYINKIKN